MRAAKAIGEVGGEAAVGGILPVHAHAANQSQFAGVVGAKHGEKFRNVGRIVLPVAIERDDDFAAGRPHAGADRPALAEIAVVADGAEVRDFGFQGPQFAGVPSVEPSSTKMISAASPAVAAAISRASGPRFRPRP